MKPYALKMEPIFKTRIWGGQTLRSYFGKPIPAGECIGESWELADLPEGQSRIGNGPWAGKTLSELSDEDRKQIYPSWPAGKGFPLLVKLLDAQDVLSVQVHPDADTCRRNGQGDPKTECWYIIDAKAGAVIYKGLRPGTTRHQMERAIEDGTVEGLLNRVDVHPGECHFIPAGTCHAIGPGLLIAEIQTPSDTTYRVFDWNRLDDQGHPRPLHIRQALDSIHFQDSPALLTVRTEGVLVDCDSFSVEKCVCSTGISYSFDSGVARVLSILSGRGQADNPDGSITPVRPGDTLLIPADFIGELSFASDGRFLLTTLKHNPHTV